MRGYKMIEKEIELINSRKDKDNFIKTLSGLNSKKRQLIENKELTRIENSFYDTPIIKSKNFIAANIIYKDTKFIGPTSLIKLIFAATIIGFALGISYVLVSDKVKKYRN